MVSVEARPSSRRKGLDWIGHTAVPVVGSIVAAAVAVVDSADVGWLRNQSVLGAVSRRWEKGCWRRRELKGSREFDSSYSELVIGTDSSP